MRFLLLPILLMTAYCGVTQVPGVDYKLYDARLKKETTIEAIAAGIGSGEVLVFGEQHDDSIGHLMEKKVLEALYAKQGNAVMLAMEMFHRDVQYILDEYLAGLISEKNFVKEARAWDSYKTDYKPAVEFAKEKHLRVIAANAPSRYTNMVTRNGLSALEGLSKEVKQQYIAPLPVDTVTGPYYDKFLEAMGGHTTPGMHLFQSQSFWDATMSWSIAEALKQYKKGVVLMFNGRFHSDYHLGLVQRLERNYKKKVTTISSFAASDFAAPDWNRYAAQGDYILITSGKPEEAQ
ncbi:ChaN family lipoprotein [Taibaiella koreensis]|uniref:ChaN family lipoprotein n=1 Tax=Taibaiella koreensis TaxID=1268548 RepID=UPI0013C2D42C|nr:ChaN family lipoprotein [Taibaiella koreensis]